MAAAAFTPDGHERQSIHQWFTTAAAARVRNVRRRRRANALRHAGQCLRTRLSAHRGGDGRQLRLRPTLVARTRSAMRADRGAEACNARQRAKLPRPVAQVRAGSVGYLQLGRDRVGDGQHPTPGSPHPRRGRLRPGRTQRADPPTRIDALAGVGAQHGGIALPQPARDRNQHLAPGSAPRALRSERHRPRPFRRWRTRADRRAGHRHHHGTPAREKPYASAACIPASGGHDAGTSDHRGRRL